MQKAKLKEKKRIGMNKNNAIRKQRNREQSYELLNFTFS